MQYIILIYSQPPPEPVRPTPEEMQKWFDYNDELQAAGAYIAGEALMPTAMATSIRTEGSGHVVTDGPFAETREALGGFYLIKADNLDDAIAWGKKCPGVAYGTIEVRPIMAIPGK